MLKFTTMVMERKTGVLMPLFSLRRDGDAGIGDLVALENERPLCSFRAVLSENNSMFGYSISGLTIL